MKGGTTESMYILSLYKSLTIHVLIKCYKPDPVFKDLCTIIEINLLSMISMQVA